MSFQAQYDKHPGENRYFLDIRNMFIFWVSGNKYSLLSALFELISEKTTSVSSKKTAPYIPLISIWDKLLIGQCLRNCSDWLLEIMWNRLTNERSSFRNWPIRIMLQSALGIPGESLGNPTREILSKNQSEPSFIDWPIRALLSIVYKRQFLWR